MATRETNMMAVTEKNAPAVIQTQFEELAKLEKQISKAYESAERASNSAERAGNRKVGLLSGRREAIEANQAAIIDLADAQSDTVDALRQTFHYQEKLIEITKYLFGLGVANIAMNRTVVREIEARLRGASKRELSDLARQEMLNVINQLKAQEDIIARQEKTAKKVQENSQKGAERDQRLDAQDEKDQEHDRRLNAQDEKDAEHDRRLDAQDEKDEEHDRRLDVQADKDEEHDRRLDAQDEKDAVHDRRLNAHDKKIKEQEKQINTYLKKIEEQGAEISQLSTEIAELRAAACDKTTKTMATAAIIISIASAIISIIQILL